MTELDHITVAADTLEQGAAFLKEMLGVDMPPGGEHPRMGTHNRLLRLGESLFLELIAINPVAPAPPRARWFNLDDPGLQADLRHSPRLVTWVVRTQDIARLLLDSTADLGAIKVMSRNQLRWLITIPHDGSMAGGGALPTAIQWPQGLHPARSMPELGYSLERFEALHPEPGAYRAALASIGADALVSIVPAPSGARPTLRATIRTPAGIRILA